jgi:hypothetical protein
MAASKPAPPPPPPPPDLTEDSNTSQPSFLEKFIQQNSKLDPSESKQLQYTNEYLKSLCIIPPITPEQALPDIKPLLSLRESELNIEAVQCEIRTALQDFREAVSLCENYNQIADINREIFQFKTKRWKLNKAKSDAKDINQRSLVEEQLKQLKEPQYNEVYTDLKVMQNYYLSGINSMNHAICLARATCPNQTDQLVSCYATLNPKIGQALAKQGLGKVICMEEREAVERCIGKGVQRVVREVLG